MKQARVIKMNHDLEPLYKGAMGNIVEEREGGVVLGF